MAPYTLHLQSASRYERVEAVASFVGTDASGSFGIWPGRARFMTNLDYGLARYCQAESGWHYIACPGAVLYFSGAALFLNTRRYLRDDDYARIGALLAGQMAQEEALLAGVKDHLQRLEQSLWRRLRKLDRRSA